MQISFAFKAAIFSLILVIEQTLTQNCYVSVYDNVANLVKTCTSLTISNMYVPPGKGLELHMKDGASVTFSGGITFEWGVSWSGPLISVRGNNLVFNGRDANFLGKGQYYWDGKRSNGTDRPLFFDIETNNSVFNNIMIFNSPRETVRLNNSRNVGFFDWHIYNDMGMPGRAPAGKEALGTVGFQLWNSSNIMIYNPFITNQDDCISVLNGDNIEIDSAYCGHGYGISFSLGFSDEDVLNSVSNVIIKNAQIEYATNGIAVKRAHEKAQGSIKNVTVEQLILSDVTEHGLLIEAESGISVNNSIFYDVVGDVADTCIPLFINCSLGSCSDWTWERVNITGVNKNYCTNVPQGVNCTSQL